MFLEYFKIFFLEVKLPNSLSTFFHKLSLYYLIILQLFPLIFQSKQNINVANMSQFDVFFTIKKRQN